MYGVLFGDKHSYKDWGLIPKSRPVISPPSPKTRYIDIPEADGQLDLTESLTGEVQFENRQISIEFNVIDSRKRWSTLYSQIMNYLQGQNIKVIFDEDPVYYYQGRFTVDEWASSKKTSTIKIAGIVEPFKNELYSSVEDWPWDSFNFEESYIRDYKDLVVADELDFIIDGSRKSSVPTFIVESEDGEGLDVELNNRTFHLNDGNNRVVNIMIKNGINELKFTGNGTVSIVYQGGSL